MCIGGTRQQNKDAPMLGELLTKCSQRVNTGQLGTGEDNLGLGQHTGDMAIRNDENVCVCARGSDEYTHLCSGRGIEAAVLGL